MSVSGKDIKENNVRYNVAVIDEVLSFVGKKTRFNYFMSQNIRMQYLINGRCEKSKVKLIEEEIGISPDYLNGKTRFFIPELEREIKKNPDILTQDSYDFVQIQKGSFMGLNGLPRFKGAVGAICEDYKKTNKYIDDEGIDRLLYFLKNNYSSEGYRREGWDGLGEIRRVIEVFNFQQLQKESDKELKLFIKAAEDKITLCKAALIIKMQGKE